uniref:Saposin B-type domain-containing protein n=1 Tax=Setaria digitata TaxID=48799 RepID=A0A915Q422_9BILA
MKILLLILINFCYILAEEKKSTIDLIPREIICPFCVALIEQFQQTTEQNPSYKQALCESISGKNHKSYESCIESFTDMAVEKLKSSTAEELCKKQKLCPANFKKAKIKGNVGKPDFPEIPPVTDEQLENAKRRDILKIISDTLEGKYDGWNGKNLTFHIDLKFQKYQPEEFETSGNSTALPVRTEKESTKSTQP